MTDNSDGQVVTFYSFKGGTGRTMALANVAWILAANGKRVLVVDWDLESPGLHRFFAPFMSAEAFKTQGGVVDLIREYEWATLRGEHRNEQWHERYARVSNYAFSLNWHDFPERGQLDFLAAGRQDRNYLQLLASLNWDNFYDRLGGGQFFDALREDMKRQYDYTLIDSRTGLSDIADICTIHLPDTLVDCFTLSEQGIDGGARVAHEVGTFYRGRKIRILPVPMRVDPAEKQKVDAGREVARQRFIGLPAEYTEAEREHYWASMQVPYHAYYAYEEMLATFGDTPGQSGSLLTAYEALTAHLTRNEVTSLPSMDAATRSQINAKFIRTASAAVEQVVLRYAPRDEVWAEWVGSVLRSSGVQVHDAADQRMGVGSAVPRSGRLLVIVSAATPLHDETFLGTSGKDTTLAVYVADTPRLQHDAARSVRINGQSEAGAALSIMGLVGRRGADVDAVLAGGPRYPGDGPTAFNVPVQNPRFTGRELDLHRLRAQLTESQIPVVLQGLGGVGKTQLAMEYAYRFQGAYDVVWWIDAGQARFVDIKLADLGPAIGLPPQQKTEDNTRMVLQALGRGEPFARWLVILDNADEQAAIDPFVPRGGGHVLITSRAAEWKDRAKELSVDVFNRAESVAHLCKRVSTLTANDAERLAEAVGDLPIAVSAAGAWLAETGSAVDEYLAQIAEHGPRALGDLSSEQRVEVTWDPSLQRLEQRSPGAYRLLQYCSVLAPEIALDLVYSDEMAAALRPVDPAVSDRLYRASLVQAINRFALLKIDQIVEQGPGAERLPGGERVGRNAQIVVHRLVQQVVRGRMSVDEQESARHEMHLMLAAAAARLDVDNPEQWPQFRTLWPHLEVSGALTCQDEPVRQLLIDRIRYLWLLGGLEQGRQLATRIAKAWQERLAAPDVPDAPALRRQILHLRFNLANVLRDLGEFEESKKLDEAGLPQQRELLGPRHPHTLLSAGGLAGDLRGLGRYAEALELDETTYARWVETLGENHPRTLTALSNLAVCHRLMGNIQRALQLDEEVYRRRQANLIENHPSTLVSYGNVARDLREAGRFQESISILEQVVETYGRIWGVDSRGALGEQTNLAVSLRSAGRASDAAGYLERAYALLQVLGERRPETLACQLSRAINLLALDDEEQAYSELAAVKEVYEDTLGADHPHTIACMTNLAAATRARGESAQAVSYARASASAFGRVLGDDHPYTLAAMSNLAICSAEVGDMTTAALVVDDVTLRTSRLLGDAHPDTLRCRANRVLISRLAGEGGDDVARHEAEVLRRLTDSLGETHPAVEALRRGRLLHRTIDPHPF